MKLAVHEKLRCSIKVTCTTFETAVYSREKRQALKKKKLVKGTLRQNFDHLRWL